MHWLSFYICDPYLLLASQTEALTHTPLSKYKVPLQAVHYDEVPPLQV